MSPSGSGGRRASRAACATALIALATVSALGPLRAHAADAPPSSSDRLAASINGSTLNDTNGGSLGGGGGAALGWLHNFTPDALLGLGGEYQTIAAAHWAFGSLSGAYSGGSPDARWTLSAEAHLGSGNEGTTGPPSALISHPFNYAVEAITATETLARKFSMQLETRQFDVYTTHGNLPKVGLAFLPDAHWMLGVSYAHSFGGNLDTVLTSGRIDHYSPVVNMFAGVASGHAAPAVANIITGQLGPAPRYREGYVGLSKSFHRTEWTVTGDYLKIGSVVRWTATLACIVHLGRI